MLSKNNSCSARRRKIRPASLARLRAVNGLPHALLLLGSEKQKPAREQRAKDWHHRAGGGGKAAMLTSLPKARPTAAVLLD